MFPGKTLSDEPLSYDELFELLEKQGLQPMVCDTPVPFYENGVRCGIPTDIGDPIVDYMTLPNGLANFNGVFFCRALGDSMTGAEIYEGDWLQVETERRVQEGDYVLALVDGESTVKTYVKDEEGIMWLVAQNEKFPPIRLKESQDFMIQGVITQVMRIPPRSSYNKAMKAIQKVKEAEKQKQEIGEYQVARAIREVAPMVTVGRQWYAVFRALADLYVVKESDYDEFCVMVKEEVPKHPHLPTRLEMQRMAVFSFAKPVIFWTEKDAPVKGKRFDAYKKIAQKTKELLGR